MHVYLRQSLFCIDVYLASISHYNGYLIWLPTFQTWFIAILCDALFHTDRKQIISDRSPLKYSKTNEYMIFLFNIIELIIIMFTYHKKKKKKKKKRSFVANCVGFSRTYQ